MRSRIMVRCTDEEYAQITNKAKSNGMSLSEYVRFVCLNAEIVIKAKEEEGV